MGMIGISVPESTVDALTRIDVPGKKVKEDYHITMFYFENKLDVDDVCEILTAMHSVVRGMSSFSVKGTKVSSFPKGPDGVPVMIPIESKELMEFRAKMAKKFDSEKIKFSKTWPDYKPHLTLSYATKEVSEKLEKPVSWKVSEVVLWAGEEMDDYVIVRVPFSLKKKADADFLDMMSDTLLQFSSL